MFAEKLPKVPLVNYFPDYTGGDNIKLATDYLRMQFESKNRNKDKRIYTHVVRSERRCSVCCVAKSVPLFQTCATDTGNIAAVFNAVKDIIIKKSLAAAGLV